MRFLSPILLILLSSSNTETNALIPTTSHQPKHIFTSSSSKSPLTFLANRKTSHLENTKLWSSSSSSTTEQNDIFAPLKQLFNLGGGDKQISIIQNDYDEPIAEAKNILNRAVETKTEDPEKVFGALEDLEKLMRKKCKAEPNAASDVLRNLNGDWRLVFTTGTKDTQKKLGAKINYFPIKAVQSFDTTSEPMRIQNGIYVGDFALTKFFGDFEFDLTKRKLEFDFDQIAVLGLKINLGKGKAAEIGAASGLGSENNKKLIDQKKKPFFNWISADETIATARGGGGGLALWKRVEPNAE